MKKRQRKKLRIEEFTEWGFDVELEIDIPIKDMEANSNFLDEVIEFVESQDLYMGGSSTGFYVCRKKTATEEDRAIMLDFLSNHKNVINAKVAPLSNSWYGGKEKATRYNYKELRKKLWEE